jgi:hypothetical protein
MSCEHCKELETTNERLKRENLDMAHDKNDWYGIQRDKLHTELQQAWSVIEGSGVPKDRAKTIAGGIMVLQQRMNKEIQGLQTELQQARQRMFGNRRSDNTSHTTACTIWGDNGQGLAEGFQEPLSCNCGALENFANQQLQQARERLEAVNVKDSAKTREINILVDENKSLQRRLDEGQSAIDTQRCIIENTQLRLDKAVVLLRGMVDGPKEMHDPELWQVWESTNAFLAAQRKEGNKQ